MGSNKVEDKKPATTSKYSGFKAPKSGPFANMGARKSPTGIGLNSGPPATGGPILYPGGGGGGMQPHSTKEHDTIHQVAPNNNMSERERKSSSPNENYSCEDFEDESLTASQMGKSQGNNIPSYINRPGGINQKSAIGGQGQFRPNNVSRDPVKANTGGRRPDTSEDLDKYSGASGFDDIEDQYDDFL